jgi:hypothetical protein
MKTDRVLMIEEYLDQWGAVPMHLEPPACDARHVPIETVKEVDSGTKSRNCNCDRWGHPCPSCVEPKLQTQLVLPTSTPVKQLT